MNGTDRTDFGGAMVRTRITDLVRERGLRPHKRAERPYAPRRSSIVYVFSGFRRRWLRVECATPGPVRLVTEMP